MKARGHAVVGGAVTGDAATWSVPTVTADVDAWRAQLAAKAARERRSWDLRLAALDARNRPAPKPARKKKPTTPTPTAKPRAQRTEGPTPETQALIDAFQSGATLAELSNRTGIAVATLRRRLNAAGVKLRPTEYTPETRATIIAEYVAGAGVRELARTHRLAKDTISRWVREAGVMREPVPPHGTYDPTAGKHAHILNLYRAGNSLRDIARDTGIPRSTVQRTVQRAGIARPPLRPKDTP